MSKNKTLRKHDELLDIDFLHGASSPGDEAIARMMQGLIEVSHHQQGLALELTKLVVERSADPMNEEKIFSVFKRSSKVIADNFLLKELWEKFGLCE